MIWIGLEKNRLVRIWKRPAGTGHLGRVGDGSGTYARNTVLIVSSDGLSGDVKKAGTYRKSSELLASPVLQGFGAASLFI